MSDESWETWKNIQFEKDLIQVDDEKWTEIMKKLDSIDSRLKNLESRHSEKRSLFGPNVWVLVPVVAIVMWGLQSVFQR